MSKIYKFNHIIDNEIKTIYIFSKKTPKKNDSGLFVNEQNIFTDQEWSNIQLNNIPYEIINEDIYGDDTIQTIKEKMVSNIKLNISTSEIYLFACVSRRLNLTNLYNELTQDQLTDLNYNKLETVFKNYRANSYDFKNDYFELEKKDLYSYDDILNLDLPETNKELIPLGQNITLKKKYPLAFNPYHNTQKDRLLELEGSNMISTQNKYILFTYGNIIDNNINFSLAAEVMNYSNGIFANELYLLQLFFPILVNKKVISLKELVKKKQKLKDDDTKKLKKYYKKYNQAINLFNNLYTNDKDINYRKKGVKYLYFTMHPLTSIKLPLEILFKIINSSDEMPLIKYNPGNRMENIYRLYTGENYATNGSKIPVLYVDYDNKKIMINKLSKELATRKKIGFYIKDKNIYTLCEFLENGNIDIKLETNTLISLDEIQDYLRKKLNVILLKKIKAYLEQSGYTYMLFESLYDNNIEIVDLKYIYSIENSEKIDLKKYINCLSSIFNIHNGTMNTSSDIISMTYKRVSSFQEMNSINAFITISKKNGQSLSQIIEGLNDNFNLEEEDSKRYFTNWQQEVQLKLDTYENKRITIESNPGFDVEIKNQLDNFNSQIVQETVIEVDNINNINYIEFLHVYIDALLKIILYPTDSDVKKICKGKKIIEVEQEEEIKNKKEKAINDDKDASSEEDDVFDALFDDDEEEDEEENLQTTDLNTAMPSNIDKSFLNQEEEITTESFLNMDDIPTFSDDEGGDDEEEQDEEEDQDEEQLDDTKESEKSASQEGTLDMGDLPSFDDFSDDDDDDDPLGELSETEGGGLDIDLEGLSISGANNIFMKRLRDRDPKLFLKKKQGKFNAYSTSCGWQYKKQPIILTREEKEHIDKKDAESNSRSYDEYITYGSGEKKYHYICPRFWCIRDDDGQGRSLSLKDVNDGKCGGWDAVIPEGAKKVPKGKRIFEFTDKRFRRSKSNTKNPMVYKPLYPGFKKPSAHPDGLCVPCCFENPSTCVIDPEWREELAEVKGKNQIIYVKKDWVYINKSDKKSNEKQSRKNKPLLKIKEGWYHKDDKEFKEIKKPLKECPSVEMDTYQPGGPNDDGPSFDRDSKGNIVFSSINKDGKSKKHKRPSPSTRGESTYETCNQSVGKSKSKKKRETKPKRDIFVFDKGPLIDAFPLKSKQTGYLSLTMQKFLGYNSRELCQVKGKSNLKIDKFCLLRVGVNQHSTQSFLSCIAFLYNSLKNGSENVGLTDKTISIKELKKIMLTNLTLDKFVSVYNGILPSIFKSDRDIIVDDYKSSIVYNNMKADETYINNIISAYETFKDYLLDDNVKINYEYLWDFICQSTLDNGILFENGINLLIFNSPSDDLTEKIELICPRIDYSQEIYNSRKNTVIIYSKNDYYEPICQVKQTIQKKKRKIINTFFNNENLNRNTPEVMSLLYEIINDKLKIFCKSEPSINTDKFFVKNKSSYEIIDILTGLNLNYDVKNQIVNTNNQVIALIIEKDGENIYLPVLPSSINKEYGFSSFKSKDIYFDYDVNVKLLNDIYVLTDKKIPCSPKMKIESEGMIVGLLTLTNQFVPVVPIDVNSISDKLKVIKNESYLDVDINTMSSTTIDSERYLIVKKIKLETNFYNMFRNIFKILINKKHNKENKGDIIDIINSVKINYFEKIEQISEKMRDILKDDIDFIDYKVSNLNEIEKLVKCFGLSEGKCSKTINCSFSDKKNCVLLIPKKNLLNDSDNSINYYIKVSDEIIRFPQIKKFIFTPKTFLSFERVNYNLSKNEIILLEDVLLNKYFEDLLMIEFNKYISDENIFEIVHPNKHIPYKTLFNMTVNTKKVNQCVYTPEKPLSLKHWKEYFNSTDEIEINHYKQSPICSFQIICDIINDVLKKEKSTHVELDIISLKKELYHELVRFKKGRETEDIVKKMFAISSKVQIKKTISTILNNDGELQTYISSADYFATEIDMYLLFTKYKVNVVMLLKNSKNIYPVFKKNIFSTVQDEKPFYMIINGGMETKSSKSFPDKARNSLVGYPRYGLIYINNNISHEQKYFTNLIAKIGGFMNASKLLSHFIKEEDERIKKKREQNVKHQRKYRKKANIKLTKIKKVGTIQL